MADELEPLLIKRYASRRLYNTETSDYVTLDDIAEAIRDGRDVQIVDLKSGSDLTRQYLLQIIAEHESRGENVLPVNVLTDLVRSYATQAQGMLPQFLSQSFDMFRENQAQWMAQMNQANPLAKVPGMDAIYAQQEAFLKAWSTAMTGGLSSRSEPKPEDEEDDSLTNIKAQLNKLQAKLSKLEK